MEHSGASKSFACNLNWGFLIFSGINTFLFFACVGVSLWSRVAYIFLEEPDGE